MKAILKLLAGLIIIFCTLTNTGYVAYADLIWTPDDEFYEKHSDECVRVERSFTANGPEGETVLWKSPGSKKKIATFENETEFYVEYVYTDKKEKQWGIVQTVQGSGWLRMEELLFIYDNIAFCEQHVSEFRAYNGEFDDYVVEEAILLWTYPGSGKTNGKISEFDNLHSIQYVYTDQEGRQWGYYAFTDTVNWNRRWGYSAAWICLTDPINDKLPVIKYEITPDIIDVQPYKQPQQPGQTQAEQGFDKDNSSIILYLGIAVITLLVATAVLIRIFWKKDKK